MKTALYQMVLHRPFESTALIRHNFRVARNSDESKATSASGNRLGSLLKVVEVLCSQPVHQKIHGMTEKYVLRESVRDVITETVYKRQKHPFLSPPATLNPKEKLSALVNDTLRGPVLASIPFFDQKRVVALLDSLHTMDEGTQVANDQVLMILVSACVLQERFGLESGTRPELRSSALAS